MAGGEQTHPRLCSDIPFGICPPPAASTWSVLEDLSNSAVELERP